MTADTSWAGRSAIDGVDCRKQGPISVRQIMAHFLVLIFIIVPVVRTGAAADRPHLPPRVASGDITSEGAIIWGQIDAVAEMEVEYSLDSHFQDSSRVTGQVVDESSDFAGHVELQNLVPATRYFYRVSFRERDGQHPKERVMSQTGTFRTAPLRSVPTAVSFVFSGDLGGQGYCRHAADGYRIFTAMLERSPDFFVENGDFIYADYLCASQGPAGWSNVPGTFASVNDDGVDWTDRTTVSTIYRDHWRYQFEDEHLSKFLRHVPLYPQWDDHEVINDAGWSWNYWNSDAHNRVGFENLVEAGREAFFNICPSVAIVRIASKSIACIRGEETLT